MPENDQRTVYGLTETGKPFIHMPNFMNIFTYIHYLFSERTKAYFHSYNITV